MSKISLILILSIFLSSCLRTPDPEQSFLSEIFYPELEARVSELNDSSMSENWLHIIDFGDQADFEAGHIEHAINIELKYFISSEGYLVNRGKAITERFDDDWPFIIYSSSNDTIAYWAAKTIKALEFPKVYFYEGGIEDWMGIYGDFLIIEYPAVKSWHDEYYPFEDSLMAMVDIHPSSWYRGTEVLSGHIPGAINIPASDLVSESGVINEGTALSEVIPDKSAKIVVYYALGEEESAKSFIKAAMELGYTRLFLFKNGYDLWIENGNELTTE